MADTLTIPVDSRASLIAVMVQCAVALTEELPMLRVPLTDLPLWASALWAREVLLSRRHDGRVIASVNERVRGGRGWLLVTAVADIARDVEVPAEPDAVRIPVVELSRLELRPAVEDGVA